MRRLATPGREQLALTLARARRIPAPMLIYKIFLRPEWNALRAEGQTKGAPIDIADGYVHFSTSEQAPETAAKYFADQDGLFLVAVETDRLGDDLKWEPSRGAALFPHLYRMMLLTDVAWAQPLPFSDGVHQFPPGFADAT